jgi:hypothetical protein
MQDTYKQCPSFCLLRIAFNHFLLNSALVVAAKMRYIHDAPLSPAIRIYDSCSYAAKLAISLTAETYLNCSA